MRKQLEINDRVEFVSGNFAGCAGTITALDFESTADDAIFGYLHTCKLDDGRIVFIEKSEHWRHEQTMEAI